MIRVLVVDDSLFMRTIIRDMLENDPDIEVVDTAKDGFEAIQKIEKHSPDIVTLDIEMPRMDGLTVLRQLSGSQYTPKTMILSSLTSKDAQMTRTAMGLGADDFMFKPTDVRGIRGIDRELRSKVKNLMEIKYAKQKTPVERRVSDHIVVIGSSAGGPQMLDQIFSTFSRPLRTAVVVTQHMPAGGFTASLATRLNRISSMPVQETENGDPLLQGMVYISKAGYHTIIAAALGEHETIGGKIIHSRSPPVHSVRPAVDKTFCSAASVFGPQCISVILSGMGNDGGEGMAVVKQQGGSTLVCQEKDCLVYGMARAALRKNCVDRVVPLREMCSEIEQLIPRVTV